MIPRDDHPVADVSWSTIAEWIQKNGRMPSGEPLSKDFVAVLMVGVWLGCRFALLHPPIALGVAEKGNNIENAVFAPFQRAFNVDWLPWLTQQMQNAMHNHGFNFMIAVSEHKSTADAEEAAAQALTDEDAKAIMGGLDELFKEKPDA